MTHNLRKKTMDNCIFRKTGSQKSAIDKQVARFVYASNSSFRCVEQREFKNRMNMLHLDYIPLHSWLAHKFVV